MDNKTAGVKNPITKGKFNKNLVIINIGSIESVKLRILHKNLLQKTNSRKPVGGSVTVTQTSKSPT